VPKLLSTTSGRLLTAAIARFGIDRLAGVLQTSANGLLPFANGEYAMSLEQQRTLALGVLALAPSDARLRSQTSALLAQVRAVESFTAGETQRHATRPIGHWW
jgi:hypothetical protein